MVVLAVRVVVVNVCEFVVEQEIILVLIHFFSVSKIDYIKVLFSP